MPHCFTINYPQKCIPLPGMNPGFGVRGEWILGNLITDLSITPPESPLFPLLGANESSSSKNITHGVALLALSNTEIK